MPTPPAQTAARTLESSVTFTAQRAGFTSGTCSATSYANRDHRGHTPQAAMQGVQACPVPATIEQHTRPSQVGDPCAAAQPLLCAVRVSQCPCSGHVRMLRADRGGTPCSELSIPITTLSTVAWYAVSGVARECKHHGHHIPPLRGFMERLNHCPIRRCIAAAALSAAVLTMLQ